MHMQVNPMVLILALAAAAVPVAASARDKDLGRIVQNNIVAMAVDLNPAYAGVKIEGGDGMVAEAAATRYRTGRVKPLLPLSSTAAVGSASATGGAAGGAQAAGPR